jgi:hypothetical protein
VKPRARPPPARPPPTLDEHGRDEHGRDADERRHIEVLADALGITVAQLERIGEEDERKRKAARRAEFRHVKGDGTWDYSKS